ncbi:MAG: hypothetical protein WC858_02045 [Parcubacteria group bacterium]|jgi:hypothetical protein
MENKTKYSLIVVTLILIAVVFAYQQKTIMNLNGKVDNLVKAGSKNQQAAVNDPYLLEAVQKTIKENTKELKGSVVSKDRGSMIVEADMVNFPKLSGLSDAALKQADSFPKIKKKLAIAITADTEFPLKWENIKIGDNVHVFTDNLIYRDEKLTAKKVWVIPNPGLNANFIPSADFSNSVKYIGGAIKEIGNNYFVVEAQWIEPSKAGDPQNVDPATAPKISKTYKVLIDSKTVFSKSGKNDLRVGDNIDAYSNAPVFSLAEFTATKIEGPL